MFQGCTSRAVEAARTQARTYADRRGVRGIGVSDGFMLYAADIDHGVLRGRMSVALDSGEPQEDLSWWLSEHGVYRPRDDAEEIVLRPLSNQGGSRTGPLCQ